MKEITKIRIENLKDAEYITVMLNKNNDKVWTDIYKHTFTEMLDIMLTTNDIDTAVEMIDVTVGNWWTVTDEISIDEMSDEEPMMIMRVK